MNKNKKYLLLIISIYFLLTGLSYSQVSSLNICLSRDSTNFYDSVGFPMVGMGDGVVFGPEDWTYENPKLTMYLLVTGTQPFFASDLIINFDSSKTKLSVLPGNLFANYFMDTISIGLGSIRINIASLASNVMPQPNKYLIKLLVKILKPGYSNLKIQNSDFRYFDEINNVSINVPTNIFNGAIKFYLGDFAHSRTEINRGDGDVNFKDASVFFQHYGSSEGDGIYERKFDISGGSSNFDYYTLPSTDGSINFYDLIMFVMGYEKEGSGLLMRMNSKLPQSLEGFKVDISSYNQNGNVTENWNPIDVDRRIIQQQIDLEGYLFDWERKGYKVAKLENATLKNKNYYKIRLTTPENDTIWFYIDPKNNLISFKSFGGDLSDGKKHASVEFQNYKKVENINIPFKRIQTELTLNGSYGETDILISEVQINPKFDSDIFKSIFKNH